MKTVLRLQHEKILSGICLVASVFVILSLSAGSVEAKGKPKPRPTVQKTAIESVTATSVTVKEQTGMKTFTISSLTEVTVNGQRATIADLKPGMFVSVTLRDPTNASRIVATSQ
jgi:hypothetical protein